MNDTTERVYFEAELHHKIRLHKTDIDRVTQTHIKKL